MAVRIKEGAISLNAQLSVDTADAQLIFEHFDRKEVKRTDLKKVSMLSTEQARIWFSEHFKECDRDWETER